jgi:hypothetical protein
LEFEIKNLIIYALAPKKMKEKKLDTNLTKYLQGLCEQNYKSEDRKLNGDIPYTCIGRLNIVRMSFFST